MLPINYIKKSTAVLWRRRTPEPLEAVQENFFNLGRGQMTLFPISLMWQFSDLKWQSFIVFLEGKAFTQKYGQNWTKMSHSVHILSIQIDAKIQQHIIVLLYRPYERRLHVEKWRFLKQFCKSMIHRCTSRIQQCICGNCATTLRTCVRWKIKVSRFDLRET